MKWVLLDRHGDWIAVGSRSAVLEAGEEHRVIRRCYGEHDGLERAPEILPGYVLAPLAMFPGLDVDLD